MARQLDSARVYSVFVHNLVEKGDNSLRISPVFTLRTERGEHNERERFVLFDHCNSPGCCPACEKQGLISKNRQIVLAKNRSHMGYLRLPEQVGSAN